MKESLEISLEDGVEDWKEDRKLVYHELKRLNDNVEHIMQWRLDQVKEVTALKTKASIFGALSGFLISIISDFIRK